MRRLLSKVWHKNWTPHWGWVKLGVGSSAVGIEAVGKILNDGSVKSAIDALHIDPKWMLVIAILGVVTLLSSEH